MPRARYKLLVDGFVADIRAGRLAPGSRLPTHRQLAAQAGVALVTASRVYAELEAMGLVSGEAGRGTFVRETALPPGQGIDQQAVAAGVVDLNFNYPSVPGQADLLRTALRQLALSGDLDALLRYQPHGGRLHERASVARHLALRGLTVPGEQVLLVNGAQHGLAVTLMALFKPGCDRGGCTDLSRFQGRCSITAYRTVAYCREGPRAGPGAFGNALPHAADPRVLQHADPA